MTLNTIIKTLFAFTIIAAFGTAAAKDKDEAALQAEAKISKADAEKTALDKVPDGKVKESELKKEKGKLIWSFDIARPGTSDITEVNVDAISGKIVNVEVETAKDLEKEAKEDKEKGEKDDKKD